MRIIIIIMGMFSIDTHHNTRSIDFVCIFSSSHDANRNGAASNEMKIFMMNLRDI